MRLLPFEFEVVYQPGSKMGKTDRLSRSPHLEAAEEPPDETELIVALIKEFNNQKNRTILGAVLSKWEADLAKGDRVRNKKEIQTKRECQIARRANANAKFQAGRRRERCRSKDSFEMPNETIKQAYACISLEDQPIRSLREPSERVKKKQNGHRIS